MEKKLSYNLKTVSSKELIQDITSAWFFLLSRWRKVLFMGLIGGLLGFGYAYIQPVKYVAKLSFVVEDPKSGAGGLAALAGQFGFDLGGSTGGGVFSGDNILIFLKSEGLVRETLMTYYDEENLSTLADKYIISENLKSKWEKNSKIGLIHFGIYKNKVLPRKEDSLIQYLVNKIRKSDLTVSKPDKKASFIEVKVSTRDESFSQLFAEKLVNIAIKRYVESKTNIKVLNVNKLEQKADSLSRILNSKTFAAAANQQSLVDANPAMRTVPIASEISVREKTMAATIFAEVVKNLEISKTILSQETPIIQMVDRSTLPLQKVETGKLGSLLFGSVFSGLMCCIYLLIKRWVKINL